MNTEDIVIAYTKMFDGQDITDRYATPCANLINHGRKLIAEREPKIMPVEERANRLVRAPLSPLSPLSRSNILKELQEDRATIAAVLDKGLTEQGFHPEGDTVARLMK